MIAETKEEMRNTRLRRGRRPEPDRTVLAAQVRKKAEDGMSVTDACRLLGIAPTTYYRWRGEPLEDAADRTPPEDADVRQAIIAAAKSAFMEQGYQVSLSAIAQAAGVARQTLYNMFGSKRALFKEVLSAVYAGLTVLDHQPRADGPLRDILMLFGQRYRDLSVNLEALALNRLTIGQYPEAPDVSAMIIELGGKSAVSGLRGPLATLFEKQQALGRVRDGDPKLMADAFQSAVFGMPRLRALTGLMQNPKQLDEHLACVVDIFVTGLAPPQR